MAKLRNITGLSELCKSQDLRPRLEQPELSELPGVDRLIDYVRIQPTKMRKGKSGEIEKRGGKKR